MKTRLLFFFTLISINLSAQVNWSVTETGQTDLIEEISSINNVIWAKDQKDSNFSISIDQGKTWVMKQFPSDWNQNTIGVLSAINETTAYVILSQNTANSNAGLYKTTDAGNTWVRESTIFNNSGAFPNIVHFWNENEGFTMGDGLEVYAYKNGTWSTANLPSTNATYSVNSSRILKVVGNNTVYMSVNTGIFKSVDKGLNWTEIAYPSISISSFVEVTYDFKDDANGLLIYNDVANTQIFSTTNGGATWVAKSNTQFNNLSTRANKNLRYIPSLQKYIYVGSNGLFYSDDDGNSWTKNTYFDTKNIVGDIDYSTEGIYMGRFEGEIYFYSNKLIIHDQNFEQALIDLGHDTTIDGFVDRNTINQITTLDVSSKNISDTRGIEGFTSLEALGISSNSISKIDLAQNTTLKTVYVSDNQLTNLDVSSNTALEDLVLDRNQITSLDVSKNLSLKGLSFSGNQISEIDLSVNTSLENFLWVNDNQLTLLDLTNNPLLKILHLENNNFSKINIKNGGNENITDFNATGNANLTCIEVDDATYATTNFTSKDSQTTFNEDCTNISVVYIPDANMKAALVADTEINTNNDTEIQFFEAEAITGTLTGSGLNIADLTGIEAFKNITGLDVNNNNLTTIDLSKNTKLTFLNVAHNQLTLLDVANNTALIQLFGYNNQLTKINFGNQALLEYLYLGNNNISYLNLSSMINLKRAIAENNKLITLNVNNSPNLEWYTIFGNEVISVNFSNNPKLTSIWTFNNKIKAIDVSNLPDLQYLRLSGNQIPTIDVTANVNLKNFEMDGNGLTSLDLSKNTLLEYIFIGNNPNIGDLDTSIYPNLIKIGIDNIGTSIADFTNSPNLEEIFATNNNIGNINLSNNPKLTRLWLNENPNLTGLSVNNMLVLEELGANNTKTPTIDVTANVALRILELGNTGLSSIDISKNTQLESLLLYDNNMTDIDVSQNVLLKKLDINQIKKTGYLDLSQHTLLEDVVVNNTLLASLNLNNNNNAAITRIEILDNPNLMCVQVDDVTNATNNWTFVDENTNFSTGCGGPIVYIPDANMKAALVADTEINTNNDTEIQVSEAEVITGSISGTGLNIADLTGIEAFINITGLDVSNNNLTTVDVSKNTKLTFLNVAQNQLTNLDVSANIELVGLYLGNNQLTAINLTNNPLITQLNVNDNLFTSLDFTNNTALTFLGAYNNNLTSIDVSKNTLLTYLGVFNNKLTSIDVSQNTELDVFSIRDNLLTALDVSKSTKLRELFFFNNNVKTIDFSKNIALERIGLDNTELEEIDLSNQPNLKDLYASNNKKLIKLNLKNGNNTNINHLNLSENTNLTCIEVDDVAYSTANWNEIEDLSALSTNCYNPETVTISDTNFEQTLIDLGLDTNGLNGNILKSEAAAITTLSISKTPASTDKITDLTGIEAMINLVSLEANYNAISSLNLSKNTSLALLSLGNNSLTELNVKANVALTTLALWENNLTAIDVSKNINLVNFYISDNNFTSLDVTKLIDLENLSIRQNQITAINITKNTKLWSFDAFQNQLKGVDVSKNTELLNLYLQENNIINVDINQNKKLTQLLLNDNKIERAFLQNGNNTTITVFSISNNPDLKCIAVDDIAFSNTNWTNKDATASYNTDCSAEWEVYTTDESFSTALETIPGLDDDNDGVITYEEAQAFTGDLDLSGKNITSVIGLEAFTNAASINISGNSITDISSLLSANTVLISSKKTGKTKSIARAANGVKKLNVNGNLIEEIDISEISSITELIVSNNKLTYLNVNNSANSTLVKLDATGNADLGCIQVDNVANATANANWTKDATASYNTFCAKTALFTDSFLRENIAIYPNPATTNIQISVSNGLALKSIEVYNLIGKKLLKSKNNTVDIKDLATGMYLIKIHTDKGNLTKKIIKN